MKKVLSIIRENDFATFGASWIVVYFVFLFICDVKPHDIWDFTAVFLVIGWPFALLAVPFVTVIADLGSR